LDEKNSILSCYVCMGQSLSHLLVHALFSPKDRRPFLRSKELRNASLLASDGGIDDRSRLGEAAVPRSRCRP